MNNTGLLSHQYLTLSIMDEYYAFPVERVREVLEYTKITALPCRADYFKGLINVRGNGIPVLDLRARFGMPGLKDNAETSIIVVEMTAGEKNSMFGLLADSVHEVIELDESAISPVPEFGSRAADAFLKSMGKIDNDFVLILDPDLLLREEDEADIKQSVQTAGNPEN